MPNALTREQVADILARTSMFTSLNHADLLQLAEVCIPRHYGRGEYLMRQGDPGDRLVVIASGQVKVVISSPDGADMMLITLGPGETLGELAVFDGSPRSASVVAMQPTSVLLLGSTTLLNLLGHRPRLLKAVLAHLTGTIRRLTSTASDLVFLDLGGRLAKVLLHIDGAVIDQHRVDHLTQGDLAAAIGASRQATNKALHVMAAQGWIDITDGQVLVLDSDALKRRAGLSPG